MSYLLVIWAIFVGVYADEVRISKTVPKLGSVLSPLRPYEAQIGLVTAVLGVLGFLAAIWTLLGRLGLPYETLPMVWALWRFVLSLVFVVLGVVFGTQAIHTHINDSRKEEALLKLRENLAVHTANVGRVAWIGGLGLFVLTILL